MFVKLIETLKANPRTLVFTEGADARILEATARLKKDGFLTLVLQNDNKIVMNAAKVKEATPRVMFRYRIASDRSTNLTKPLVFKK